MYCDKDGGCLICDRLFCEGRAKVGEVGMIQIDIPMPKNCADCCFATADLVNGTITLFCMTPVGRKMYAPDLIGRRTRPEWCPLKEQEAVEPDTDSEWTCSCGNCGETVGYYPVGCNNPHKFAMFCPNCGRKVKWG